MNAKQKQILEEQLARAKRERTRAAAMAAVFGGLTFFSIPTLLLPFVFAPFMLYYTGQRKKAEERIKDMEYKIAGD